MLSALLTGLNRAFPFIPDHSVDKFNEQISILFKIVHVTTFNKSIQALMLLLQLMLTKKQVFILFYYFILFYFFIILLFIILFYLLKFLLIYLFLKFF